MEISYKERNHLLRMAGFRERFRRRRALSELKHQAEVHRTRDLSEEAVRKAIRIGQQQSQKRASEYVRPTYAAHQIELEDFDYPFVFE